MKRKVFLSVLMGAILLFIGSSFVNKSVSSSHPNGSKIEIAHFVIDPSKPMVAITYDDGPHQTVTPAILDTLERYNAHATFFMIGDRISHHTNIIKRMVMLGCELGNHTFGHQDLSQMSKDEMNRQLQSSVNALAVVVESDFLPRVVRPPFGNTDKQLEETCPYPMVVWSIDTRDWSHQNVNRSVEEVMSQVQDGDIILMHDMYEATAEATEIIVQKLTEEGYQLLTVSEMFEAKGIELQPGHVYHHAR